MTSLLALGLATTLASTALAPRGPDAEARSATLREPCTVSRTQAAAADVAVAGSLAASQQMTPTLPTLATTADTCRSVTSALGRTCV